MVSTRHHPRPFPEPDLPPSRSPNHTSTASSPIKTEAPPSPTESTPSTTKRRSTSTRRKTLTITDGSTALTPSKPPARRAKSRGRATSTYTHTVPSLLLTWLFVSLPLVTWDSLYVMLRPHTMPGGKYHSPIWSPYALYAATDYMYGWPAWDKRVGFTAAQAAFNIIETFMYTYYLYILGREITGGWREGVFRKMWRESTEGEVSVRGPGVEGAVLICFASAVMTLSKTVLYWFNEAFSDFTNIGHNGFASLFWLWIVPNGLWIVLPAWMIYVLGKEILQSMRGSQKHA